jgi:hypothetical protein
VVHSWAVIDWDAPRPSAEAVSQARAGLRYRPVELPPRDIDPLVTALRATHTCGGVIVARLQVVGDDEVIGWFAARNRFSEFGFFSHFLSTAVRPAVAELNVAESLDEDLGFEQSWSGTLTLDGELAALLVYDAALANFPGSPVEAKRLGAAFVDALVGDRHDRFHVYQSHRAWSTWFHGLVWDNTYLLIDCEHAAITLLCMTNSA